MSYCSNVRHFSHVVYDFLTRVFKLRLSFSEVGLTDHFILDLIEYQQATADLSVRVYKTTWKVESEYGNDIDLFIQGHNGLYNWYALQAKVMSFNGAYSDLKPKTGVTKQQWDKLIDHEAAFGSKTFYLLYSGAYKSAGTLVPTRKDCLGIPGVQEMGIGIVETSVIKSIRTNTLRSSQNLYFRHVFPQHIDSIRKLFCCIDSSMTSTRQYYRSDIDTSEYQDIYSEIVDEKKVAADDETGEENIPALPEGAAPIRIIVNKG